MKRRALTMLAAIVGAAAAQQPQSRSEARLKELMQAKTGTVPPERLAQRARLLADGEGALARRNTAGALALFERAALILHAADTEMGLVRCSMQAGEYRRALAFGAHTAGAHLDVVGGTALYAWLLHAGGQEAIARDLLQQAHARSPRQPLLQSVTRELAQPWPVADQTLLAPPTRLAPYAQRIDAGMVATGTLVRGGRAALVPAAALRPGSRYWVRNGLGETVAARASARVPQLGLAELLLQSPLPDASLRVAARDPFPGSVAMAMEFAPQRAGLPAWPLLKTGFVGAALPQPGLRSLGVGMPDGARGGPVFDRQGALCGIAVRQGHSDRLVGAARLREWSGSGVAQAAAAQAHEPELGLDAVYEQGLRAALQVLRSVGSDASSAPMVRNLLRADGDRGSERERGRAPSDQRVKW
jgi:hypothetical protein